MLGISWIFVKKYSNSFAVNYKEHDAIILYNLCNDIFFFFCFIKDHSHLSRDLKKKKKKRREQRPGFYKYRSFDRIRDRWYTYVFRTTGCVNTTELATIIGMLQTWWNFANPLQQICQSQLNNVKKDKYYLNYKTEKSRGKKFKVLLKIFDYLNFNQVE